MVESFLGIKHMAGCCVGKNESGSVKIGYDASDSLRASTATSYVSSAWIDVSYLPLSWLCISAYCHHCFSQIHNPRDDRFRKLFNQEQPSAFLASSAAAAYPAECAGTAIRAL